MRSLFYAYLVFSILTTQPVGNACAGEEFGIEESFASHVQLPLAIVKDIEGKMDKSDLACLRDAHVSTARSLEASEVNLHSGVRTLIVKPVPPPAGAWGCFCGTANCPMWIYAVNNSEMKEIWHAPGTDGVQVLDTVTNGYLDVLTSGGTAGYGYCDRSAWDGERYKTIRSEHVLFDEDYYQRVKNGQIKEFDYSCK